MTRYWKAALNAIAAAPAAIMAFLDSLKGTDVTPLLPPGRAAAILTGIALLNIVLHLMLDDKKPTA